MGDHDAGDAAVGNGLDQLVLRFGVQGAGRFVQNDDGGVLGQDPGDLQALALAAGQVLAVFNQPSLISARPLEDVVVKLGVAGGQDDLKILDGGVPHADVVGDGVLKQDDFLVHHGDRAGEHAARNLRDGFPVVADVALPGLIQARDQLADGGLTAAAAAHDGHPAARADVHGEV